MEKDKRKTLQYSSTLGCNATLLFWNIWIQRNNNRFNEKKDNISLNLVINQATEYNMLIRPHRAVSSLPSFIYVNWEPPKVGSYKFNTDGAINASKEIDGLGGVIRKHGRLKHRLHR